MTTVVDRTLCQQVQRAEEAGIAYFGERIDLPGVVLFRAERADAPEFDVALIDDVPAGDVDATLHAIIAHFHERERCPRVRLSPISAPAGWPDRLRRAGFDETGERLAYFVVPESTQLRANPAIRVERAVTAEDADRFSAIQVAGFDLSRQHAAWDAHLARRHLAAGHYDFYLAWVDDRVVGAARSVTMADGITALGALAALPVARGRGVGTTLLARMIDDARRAGSRVIAGSVLPESYAAAMYQRLGFVTLFRVQTFAAAA
jgi:GNAT superfamily N-acetyltransferase